MDESMITESEKFLNKIEKQKLDLSNLKSDFTDLESFLEVYELLNNNLNKLQDIKEDMDESGYTAPFRSLNLYGTRVSETLDNEEFGEINRHKNHQCDQSRIPPAEQRCDKTADKSGDRADFVFHSKPPL